MGFSSRIAVAGAGCIGRAHIDFIHASTHATACAIVDPAPQTRTLAAQAGPLVSARDGLANLRVTEAIATAVASGGAAHLTPFDIHTKGPP